MIGYHLLPIKYQNCTLINIIKQTILQKISCQSRKDQSDPETEKDPYPWLDLDDPQKRYE